MALLGSESWDIYNTGNITDYWQAGGNTDAIVGSGGRCNTAYLNVGGVVGPIGPFKGVPHTGDGGYIGFGYRYSGIVGSTAGPVTICTSGGGDSVYTNVLADGSVRASYLDFLSHVEICRTPAALLTQGRWYHLGFEWVSGAAPNGSFKIYVNGVLQASVTGVRTIATIGNPFNPSDTSKWGGFRLGQNQNFSGDYDDVYWGDLSGAAPWNAFLGDLRVEGQTALTDAISGGGGTFKDFIPNVGTDHGDNVDEITPDDNVTFNASSTPGDVDTYKFPNISIISGTVYGIQLMPNMIKTDPGGRTVANVVYQGGVLTQGVTQGLSQTDYHYVPEMFQTNPTTATAWTATTADNMEGGVKVIT